MKKIIFILAIISLISCSKMQLTGISGKTMTYTVKAGKHTINGGRIMILKYGYYDFLVSTNDTWIWDVPENNGFSKVTGIGFIRAEMKNSARLVYINKSENSHEFWAYFYVENVSPQLDETLKKKLIDVEIGKTYKGRVGYENGYFFVEINGEQYSVPAKGHGTPYLMNPYIGGTYTIGHDWIVKIRYY